MNSDSRDDFSAATVRLLAQRAGFVCSFPDCNNVTIGPSDESNRATSNIGTACHIVAAANGKCARRKNPDMDPEQRSSIENGIWMCATHGRLIDNDEATYSVEMLEGWRRLAELKAAFRLNHGANASIDGVLEESDLVEETIALSKLEEAQPTIVELFTNCLITQLWGEQPAMNIRDALIEMAINAFQHGGAKFVSVRVSPTAVELQDDGKEFRCWNQLADRAGGGGGAAHVRHIITAYDEHLAFEFTRVDKINKHLVCLVRRASDIRSFSRCTMDLPAQHALNWHELGCECIYLIFSALIISGVSRYLEPIIGAIPNDKRITIVIPKTSNFVADHLRRVFPHVRVICPLLD